MDEPNNWQRVGEYVLARREELRLTQEEVTAMGGPSSLTISKIENATETAYKRLTLVKLCRVLGWTVDSIDRIAAGDEPVISEPGNATIASSVPGAIEADPRLDDESRAILHSLYQRLVRDVKNGPQR